MFFSVALDNAISGFVAGAAATSILHPLDLVKVRMQADSSVGARRSTFGTMKVMYQAHGPFALWQGFSANLLGAVFTWGIYFWFYSSFKTNSTPTGHLLAAAEAGAVTTLLTNPLWVIKTRMCLQSFTNPTYSWPVTALYKIFTTEGLKGLYSGLTPALFGVSHGAVQFMVYEELKKHTGSDQTALKAIMYLFNAAASKIAATVITYPYQVVKTRLQMQTSESNGLFATISKIWKQEGIRSFYKGLGTNIIRVLPGTCITFLVYEYLSDYMRKNGAK